MSNTPSALPNPTDYDIVTALKSAGVSTTMPRIKVFRYLKQYGSLTHAALISGLAGQVDRASVYRTLALFTKHHIAQDVIVGGVRKVELTDQFHLHHHHLSCDHCGSIISFGSSKLEQALQSVAQMHHFEERTHQIEITGRCAKCR